LELNEAVDPGQVTLYAREAVNVSDLAATDLETDASVFLPSAAETMLRELDKLPDESNSLSDLLLELSDVAGLHRNCISVNRDGVCKDDVCCAVETEHNAQNQKPRHFHSHEAEARIAKLKDSSQDIVSMFISTDAPKLSFSSNSVGMFYY